MASEKFRKLSRFSNSENEDEYFEYADDPDYEEVQPSGGSRLFAFSFYGALMTLGIAFGANIVINSGTGTGVEFGQGKVQTINCQGDRNVTVTPYAGFQNANGAGNFTLDTIYIENIHSACEGKDFIIKVYSDTSDVALTLSDSETAGSSYDKFESFRFYWSDSVTVTALGSQYTDVDLLNDTSDATDFNANETGFQVTFDADNLENFANASDVYKITLETAPHTGATS